MTAKHVFTIIIVLLIGIIIGTAQTYFAFNYKTVNTYFHPKLISPVYTPTPTLKLTPTATPSATLTPTVFYRRVFHPTFTPTPSL